MAMLMLLEQQLKQFEELVMWPREEKKEEKKGRKIEISKMLPLK